MSPCLLVFLALGAAGAQGGPHRAGLVVQYGDGRVETACVRFSEPEIDGLELLERSGLPVVVQSGGVGAAVCKIGPEGCDYPGEGCFCRREGARSVYWAFYTREGDAWAYASLGAANTTVRDGDLHGWAWGLGESGSGALPPPLDLAAVCGPAESAAATQPVPLPAQATASAPSAPSPAQATAGAPPAQTTASAPSAPSPAQATAGAPPTDTASSAASSPWNYIAFGAIVALLGIGGVWLARRR